MEIYPADWAKYPAPICSVRDRRLARDWDDLVKKVRLLMAAYESVPSKSLYHDIGIELIVLDNVCRKWVGNGVMYRPCLREGPKPDGGNEVPFTRA